MKKETKQLLQGYALTSIILLMLWSNIPFFVGLAGVATWVMTVFLSIMLLLILIGLSMMDGNNLTTKNVTMVEGVRDTFKKKMWLRKIIGWILVLIVAWSLYSKGWVILILVRHAITRTQRYIRTMVKLKSQ